MFFSNSVATDSAKVVQYVGFPVESFAHLTKDEKDAYYQLIEQGGWEFLIRSTGWIIETRTSEDALPEDLNGHLFGIPKARVFTEREVNDLREINEICDESFVVGDTCTATVNLKDIFDAFAHRVGLIRLSYLRSLTVLFALAAEGREVHPADLRNNPAFRKLGNVQMLFGDRLAEILKFQNSQARQYRQTAGR